MTNLTWTHYGVVHYGLKIYHVWTAPHAEGHTAFQLTHSRDVPPQGTGHYTRLEGLLSRFNGAEVIRDDTWPKHPDGRNKKMGEMTREEQVEQFGAACDRLQAEFNQPSVKKALTEILRKELP